MKVTDHLKNADGKTLFSLEILPPFKGQNIQHIFNAIDPMMEYNPAFIDVTYHREEKVIKKKSNGSLEIYSVNKRPGTVAISAAIQNRYGVDAVPHIICGGFTKDHTEDALIELNFLNIENVLVLRGDSIKSEINFVPEVNGHHYASELLKQVVAMNNGHYLGSDLEETSASNFCIGVAGYPEKHFESPNFNEDLSYLKKKVDLGADYIVTQMFFDNQKYFNFVEKCRSIGINVPIIPGIKPLSTKAQINSLPKHFHLDLPDDLVKSVNQTNDNKAAKQVGIEWAIEQCKELKEFGVPALHFYTMSRADSTVEILKQVF